ncbi:MAG: hypothetical protein NVS1B2_12060 [Vulcanimicrobiaceae bacterium]
MMFERGPRVGIEERRGGARRAGYTDGHVVASFEASGAAHASEDGEHIPTLATRLTCGKGERT